MSDRPLMVRDDAALEVHFAPQAEELKTAALEKAALVGRVSNADEQKAAVAAQAELDTFLRLTEKARKEIKAPVIDLGRRIDAKHEQFVKEAIEERTRVSKLIADFQALELARVRAAEAAARLEAEKIEQARLAEIRRIAEAEAAQQALLQAKADEAKRLAAAARSAEEKKKAQELQRELDRQRELATAQSIEQHSAVQERFNAQSALLNAQPKPESARVDGQVVKQDWEIEVLNPYDLAKYHPSCVTITAKLGEIKELLKQGISVKGIRATAVVRSGTRPTMAQRVIEV